MILILNVKHISKFPSVKVKKKKKMKEKRWIHEFLFLKSVISQRKKFPECWEEFVVWVIIKTPAINMAIFLHGFLMQC